VTGPFAGAAPDDRGAGVVDLMLRAQAALVAGFEGLEDAAGPGPGGRFGVHEWRRPEGGGGRARVIEGGRVFERGGVNVSAVRGERVPPSLAAQHPGTEGRPWFATGVSLVLHPRNPFVPAFHANFRYFAIDGAAGPWWFGGGADLTPSYPFEEDVRHFHGALAAWCARHAQADYAAWKATCDAYFTLRHRGEMRGVGGVFFDELSAAAQAGAAQAGAAHDFAADFACVADGIDALLPAYAPLVERRQATPYGDDERRWQALRRGRYVEFNLVYDRGTLFGLQTGGHIEAILMSMPPAAQWAFDHQPAPGSREAAALAFYRPRDWGVDPHATRRTP
jgi:coproporphyrinogen III oxidase